MWNGINSLSHTKWNCKYHIVFALKYRRKEFCCDNRLEIGRILRDFMNYMIVVDAGHGSAPGMVSGNLRESDFNLELALYMYD